jgi:hypothetical protein
MTPARRLSPLLRVGSCTSALSLFYQRTPVVVVLIEQLSSLFVRLLEESKSGKQALREVRMKHPFIWVNPPR